jgi:hypothetical protein
VAVLNIEVVFGCDEILGDRFAKSIKNNIFVPQSSANKRKTKML